MAGLGSVSLPVLAALPDGSYASVLVHPKIRGAALAQLVEAARRGEQLDPDRAVAVRVIEYTVPDRDGDGSRELIALLTTITDPIQAPAEALAEAYHQRWEHESGNDQLKTLLRDPATIMRSKKPDTVASVVRDPGQTGSGEHATHRPRHRLGHQPGRNGSSTRDSLPGGVRPRSIGGTLFPYRQGC